MTKTLLFSHWLRIAGWASIAIGLGTILYVYLILKPRLDPVYSGLQQNVETLSVANSVLVKANHLGGLTLLTAKSAADFFSAVPDSLMNLQKTAKQSSELLESSSKTANKVKKGITGLMLPTKEIDKNQVNLDQTAVKVDKISDSLSDLVSSSRILAANTAELSKELDNLKPTLTELETAVSNSQSRVDNLHQSLIGAAIPLQIYLLVTVIAGLYFFLAFALFGAAALVEKRS